MVKGVGDVRFQNKGKLLLIEKGREFPVKPRPFPPFNRVARQQSPTGVEDTYLTQAVKGAGCVW